MDNNTDLVKEIWHQSQLNPTLLAVDHEGQKTTYQDLLNIARNTASVIHTVTSSKCPRVLVALEASAPAYAGMIGTLIAGGTFCPVDITGPVSRNTFIAESFSPHVILHDSSHVQFLDEISATIPRIDITTMKLSVVDSVAADYSETAYVIFTSGSSGKPKGVKIGRRAFSYFLAIGGSYFNIGLGERWAQFSNFGHDLAVMDVFLALTHCATLVPLISRNDRLFPAAAIKNKQISLWQSVPSVIELMIRGKQLNADYLSSLRIMSFCGEPLLSKNLEKLFAELPDLSVFNTYGATETVGFNTINRLSAKNFSESCAHATVALGDCVPGWDLTLAGASTLDEGEIIVTGDYLSQGYWQDEDRTREVFRTTRTDESTETKKYSTGDWGTVTSSKLYFSCRKDRQIKIRGERIELDEVDHALRKAGFTDAYSVFLDNDIRSFVESDDDIDILTLRNRLIKHLPFHAVPKTITPLPTLPRTSSGKVDRESLKKRLSK